MLVVILARIDMAEFHRHIHALVVAAGRGSRFGADTPKQYLQTLGRTILEHSVACLDVSDIDDITLVIAKDDQMATSLDFGCDKPIYFCQGGAERFLSVRAGVEEIFRRTGGDDVWVLIHDGARPCLLPSDVRRLIDTIKEFDVGSLDNLPVGAILATPVVDTLKLAECKANQAHISYTVSRDNLWQAQTPQVFRLHALRQMLDYAIDNNLMITDEASGFEHLGRSVVLVQGSRFNIKLTYPDDLKMVELILQANKS